MGDERYRVQSVGRAVDLLERIAESGGEGARLTDLARAVGLSKPATYAILATFRARGLVVDLGEGMTRRYRLGTAFLRFGDVAVANTGLGDVAMPVLRELTRVVGMTSRVVTMEGGFATVIGRVDAPGAIRFDSALGQREMPHSSGVGKVLLAAMPRDEALALVRRAGQPARTRKTLTTLKALGADLDRVAARHYAIDDEEDHEGIVCLAAALFGHEGRVTGAISITTLRQRLPPDAEPPVAATLVEHADRISAALGGVPAAEAWMRRQR